MSTLVNHSCVQSLITSNGAFHSQGMVSVKQINKQTKIFKQRTANVFVSCWYAFVNSFTTELNIYLPVSAEASSFQKRAGNTVSAASITLEQFWRK